MKKSSSAFSLIEVSLVILIISLIAAGILTTTNLIKKSRLQTAQVLTKNSPVNNISNLVAWFETSLDSSFVGNEKSDGTTISTWYDNNPDAASKNNATQSTSTNRPTFTTNIFNSGIPGLKFDGSNDTLPFDGSSLINSSYSIFIVEQKTSNKTLNCIIGGSASVANTNLHLCYALDDKIRFGHLSNNLDYQNSALSYSSPKTIMHSFIFNIAVGKKYWLNGGSSATASDTQTAAITSFAGSNIGSFLSSNIYEGNIAEIIIFNRALITEERRSIENYLGKKYNLTLNN
jgi:competence protein ComGC